ncbi:hypothetical protein S4054_24675 [Pseudoalteromonas luteoviolacea]|nr:hypothetical protein S4054_24675 [Pseudoalteromonas luteoviolacea]
MYYYQLKTELPALMKYLIYLFGLLLFSYGGVYATEKHGRAFATELERIKYLSLNYPAKAIELYRQNSARLLKENNAQTVAFYNHVLVAASSIHDTSLSKKSSVCWIIAGLTHFANPTFLQ